MRISTKGRYALRLMLVLALHYDSGQQVTLRDVSRDQEISVKYLEQIITPLNKAGFVRSTRGAQGGYTLAREPGKYTVGEILRIMEGSLAPVPCLDGPADGCARAAQCATLELWKKLNDAVSGVVDHYTLADLVESYHQKCGNDFVI